MRDHIEDDNSVICTECGNAFYAICANDSAKLDRYEKALREIAGNFQVKANGKQWFGLGASDCIAIATTALGEDK